MSIETANALFRENKLEDALKVYKKINKEHPLYEQAQFNIQLVNKRLNRSTDPLNFKKSKVATSSPTMPLDGPLVSVVMPVFNVAPYLDASIMSVLNQTYENIELIIVDDASTDNGMNIIKMYEKQDSRIKVISLEFNTLGGAGIPSNIGVDNAKGEYIAYADSDDILNEKAIENMLRAAIEQQVEVVIGDFCNFNDDTRIVDTAYDKDRWKELPIGISFSPKDYKKVFSLSPVPWRKLYKSSFLEKNNIRFPEGDYFYEDNPLHWFVLSSAKSIVLIDEVVAYHRMAREGQTMGAGAYKLSALLTHINTTRRFLKKNSKSFIVNEFVDFSMQTRWVVNRQKETTLQKILKKRFYQEVDKIDFAEDGFLSKHENRLKDFKISYPDLDLTVVIYNEKNEPIESIVSSIEKIRNVQFNVYLVNPYDDLKEDVDFKEVKGIDVISFNIHKGNMRIINSIIPVCIGKYTLFTYPGSISAKDIEELVKIAKKQKLDMLYPENFSSRRNKYSTFIRTNHLRDMNISYGITALSSYPFLWSSLINTNKKSGTDLLNYKGKYLKEDYQYYLDFIIETKFFLQSSLFTQANKKEKEFIVKYIGSVISSAQNNLDFESWSELYRLEFNNIINSLKEK